MNSSVKRVSTPMSEHLMSSSPRSDSSFMSRPRSVVSKALNASSMPSRVPSPSRPHSRSQEFETNEATTLARAQNVGHRANLRMLKMEDKATSLRKSIDQHTNKSRELKDDLLVKDLQLLEEHRVAHDEHEANLRLEKRRVRALEETVALYQKKVNQSVAEKERYSDLIANAEKENRRLSEALENILREELIAREEARAVKQNLLRMNSALNASHHELVSACKNYENTKECWRSEMSTLQKYIDGDKKVKQHIFHRTKLTEHGTTSSSPIFTDPDYARDQSPSVESFEFVTQPGGGKTSLSRMEVIERAFKRIQTMIRADSIEQAVERFIDTDDTNKNLSEMNEELNADIDRQRKEIERLTKELFDFKTQGSMSQTAINRRLMELEAKLTQTEVERQRMQGDFSKQLKMTTNIRAGIQSLARRCQGSSGMDVDAMGISDDSIATMLEMIEDRLVELTRTSPAPAQMHASVSSLGMSSSSHNMRSSHLSLPPTRDRPSSPGISLMSAPKLVESATNRSSSASINMAVDLSTTSVLSSGRRENGAHNGQHKGSISSPGSRATPPDYENMRLSNPQNSDRMKRQPSNSKLVSQGSFTTPNSPNIAPNTSINLQGSTQSRTLAHSDSDESGDDIFAHRQEVKLRATAVPRLQDPKAKKASSGRKTPSTPQTPQSPAAKSSPRILENENTTA